MRYCIIQSDGMADDPCPELGGLTPLADANTRYMDEMFATGIAGIFYPIPQGLEPGSDVGTMSVLGYDVLRYYTGRAPVECAGMGIDLSEEDVAYRLNLVTIEGELENGIMVDYSAGHIKQAYAEEIIEFLRERFNSARVKVHAGLSYRHILVWRDGPLNAKTFPPHDIMGKPTQDHLPQGEGAGDIISLMKEMTSHLRAFVSEHFSGQVKANAVWLWGQGKRAQLPPVSEIFGGRCAVVAAVDLIKGIGRLAGMDVIEVEGATGDVDTNFAGKGEAAVRALEDGYSMVLVHVEAPDEAGHRGSPILKKEAIEKVDREVVGRVFKFAEKCGDVRVMVTCDHRTPCRLKTHERGEVPFLMFGPGFRGNSGRGKFSEETAKNGLVFSNGNELIKYFTSRSRA